MSDGFGRFARPTRRRWRVSGVATLRLCALREKRAGIAADPLCRFGDGPASRAGRPEGLRRAAPARRSGGKPDEGSHEGIAPPDLPVAAPCSVPISIVANDGFDPGRDRLRRPAPRRRTRGPRRRFAADAPVTRSRHPAARKPPTCLPCHRVHRRPACHPIANDPAYAARSGIRSPGFSSRRPPCGRRAPDRPVPRLPYRPARLRPTSRSSADLPGSACFRPRSRFPGCRVFRLPPEALMTSESRKALSPTPACG